MYFEQVADRQYILRIARGENLIKSLENFCAQENITGGFFSGIGAVDKVELAHYDVESQQYSSQKLDQPLEVTNLTGTIAGHHDELIIHAHGTFSDTQMHCLGGHVVDCLVSGTLELLLIETEPLHKVSDPETGLKLLDLNSQL